MLAKMVPVLIGLGTLQLSGLADQVVAMWPIWVGPTLLGFAYPLDGGSNIILAAAQRLYQFPLGVFGIAVATAVFPMLSRQADDGEAFGATLRRGVRLSLFIGLPASIGLMLVRHDVMPVLFRFGSKGFSPQDLSRAAAVLLGYAPAIWAYSLYHLFTRAFYAKGDMTTPMRVGIATVVLNVALTWTLIWWLSEAGMAWSTSIAAMVQCVILARLCRTRLQTNVMDSQTARGVARLILIALLMGTGVWAVQSLMPAASSWRGHALRLAAACGAGAVIYPLLSILLRAPELGWLLHRGKIDQEIISEPDPAP
jgi:putative peptidoglycan lipid II flippase